MKFKQSDWEEFFPLDKPRAGQIEAINFCLEELFERGKDNVLLDLPTGAGKSAIAVTVGRYVASKQHEPANEDYRQGSYFLTTQKILQQQYLKDFSDESRGGMLELKSSSNYPCGYYTSQSCGESKRVLNVLGDAANGTDWKKHCTRQCAYTEAKKSFIEGHLGITNYSFFLAETNYVGKLEPRDLLVMDECHTIESEICKFVELEITDRFCKKHLGISMPAHEDQQKIFDWLVKTYQPKVNMMIYQLKKAIQAFKMGDTSQVFRDAAKQHEQLDKHISKINRYVERFEPDLWIVNREKKQDARGQKNSLQFKPIDSVQWTQPCLLRFGRKRIMMSATVLDKDTFCKSIGIDSEKTAYLSLASTFPKENRPVYYMPVGKMSMADIDTTLPKMLDAVKQILEAHGDQKGIVHTTNYKISRFLHDNLNSIRTLVHDDKDRDVVLSRHCDSSQPTVLITPSMTEGVSLDGDLARFAIIVKLPYPSLADKSIKKRITRDPWYYDYLTVRTFVQSLGRGVRSETDSCTTYVLDGCFDTFYKKNKKIMPKYIQEAIIF